MINQVFEAAHSNTLFYSIVKEATKKNNSKKSKQIITSVKITLLSIH